jgi:hypothetical protein
VLQSVLSRHIAEPQLACAALPASANAVARMALRAAKELKMRFMWSRNRPPTID